MIKDGDLYRAYCRLFTRGFIRPGPRPGRWGNSANFAALNIVPLSSEGMGLNPYRDPGAVSGLLVEAGIRL